MAGKVGTSVTNGANYTSTTNKTGVAFKAGYVIANVGCPQPRHERYRREPMSATPPRVVDTKAAIRYLRYNDAAMPGTTDRILITGTSGGGGLSV